MKPEDFKSSQAAKKYYTRTLKYFNSLNKKEYLNAKKKIDKEILTFGKELSRRDKDVIKERNQILTDYFQLIKERNKVISKNLFNLMRTNKKILAIIGAGHEKEVLEMIKDREVITYSFTFKNK